MSYDSDIVVGGLAAAGGATGITFQVITNFANLTILVINLLVALGGLYLLWLRIRRQRREEELYWNGEERRSHERSHRTTD